jgi:hypothetical protein
MIIVAVVQVCDPPLLSYVGQAQRKLKIVPELAQ